MAATARAVTRSNVARYSAFMGEFFGASVYGFDAGKVQRFDHMIHERYFFAGRFQQCYLPSRAHNFEWETGEARTSANIEQTQAGFVNEG